MSEKLISALCAASATRLGNALHVSIAGWTPARAAGQAGLPGWRAAVRGSPEWGAMGTAKVYSEYTRLDRLSGPERQPANGLTFDCPGAARAGFWSATAAAGEATP
jgi:hypothetical protein